MLGPDQIVIWADLPFPANHFPAVQFDSFGLGGETESAFIYVPRYDASNSVLKEEKKMSEAIKGGRSYDLIPPTQPVKRKGKGTTKAEKMRGSGADPIQEAFRHPVKVLDGFNKLICVRLI